MSITAIVRGNLTKDPESKTVTVDGEQRRIVELRVFSDEYRNDGDTLVQDDNRCIGIDATMWAERPGDSILKHLKKGARVEVKGPLYPHRYRDKETHEPRIALQMTAESVTLVLTRIEEITFTPPRNSRPTRDDLGQYEPDGVSA